MLKKTKPKNKQKIEKSKKISQLEFEKKVIELAEKGLTSEKIGEELRQQKIQFVFFCQDAAPKKTLSSRQRKCKMPYAR